MAEFFVTVPREGEEVEVFEFIDYRAAERFAFQVAGSESGVELRDYRGRALLRPGVDEWDGTGGTDDIPLAAGRYVWDEATSGWR